MMPVNYDCVLIKYGELALRGANRPLFEKALRDALNEGVSAFGGLYAVSDVGRLVVRTRQTDGEYDFLSVAERVSKIAGVVCACPALSDKDISIENIKAVSLKIMRSLPRASFRVTATRADKNYPLSSTEIAAVAGEHILANTSGFHVDLSRPQINLRVEVRGRVFFYIEEVKGFGGLPRGTAGAALALLSGGIDSPVAMFLTGKRGVKTDAVYFHAPPYISERALIKTLDICAVLSQYIGQINLYCVHFTPLQDAVKAKSPPEKFTILLKRAMLKTAAVLSETHGYDALIMGDSLGQVASQTIKSIAAIDAAVRMSVIRPLAGFDKKDITEIARKIGTFDISIRPYNDCCTLFVPPHPETKPKISIIEAFEKRVTNLDILCEAAAKAAEVLRF